jgi:hypothetical protein
MQRVHSAEMMIGVDQSRKAEDMIAMEVTDEDVFNSVSFDREVRHADLGPFAAIDEIKLIVVINGLRRGKPALCRECGITSEYRDFELHLSARRLLFFAFGEVALNFIQKDIIHSL